ncbi:MAG: protein kinase, partial [bacterium]
QIAASEEERERFKIEAQAAAALNHPNIATIYAIEEHDDEMFIVMEYIEGKELREIITANFTKPLRFSKVTDYATQVASGLQAAHEKDVTHRDIKSSNIMVTDKGQIKIMDFGLAKIRGGAQFTKVGTTLGTAAYMSPEQAQGMETDHRTDIWSFGVVLYEMLSGQLPFRGEYEQAVIYSVLNEEPDCQDIPDDVRHVVQKALAKQREERFQSAHDLLAQLNSLQRSSASSVSGLPHQPATKKWPILMGGMALIALLAAFLPSLFKSNSSSVSQQKSIAVLPFADMSPERDQEYFGDGMAEELINALAQIPGLKVSARTSAFQFKGQEVDIQSIGEKLGVATVLEGSVRKSKDKLRVTAQLVNVADGFHLWSQTYERKMTDIFAIQDDLSRSIVRALQVKLIGDQMPTPGKRQTSNIEAYNLYLKGRYFWNRRTEEGLKKSIDFFQQAIDLDPEYALAYTGLADAYSILAGYFFASPKDVLPHAKEAAQRALELDENLAAAHLSLAWILLLDWDWHQAESEFVDALKLDPNNAFAHYWYSIYLDAVGRTEEAETEVLLARELQPLVLQISTGVGVHYITTRQYDRAIEELLRTLEVDPGFAGARYHLSRAYIAKGMFREALAEIDKYETSIPIGPLNRAVVFWGLGRREEAMGLLAKARVAVDSSYVDPVHFAKFYALIGDTDEAFKWLERGYQERSVPITAHLDDQLLDPLRSDPRFHELVRKMGLTK